jgi:hypothetical protein
MAIPAAREPGPLVILLRFRTVAKVDSILARHTDELRAAVEALPACTQKTTAPQKELLTVAAAILPK